MKIIHIAPINSSNIVSGITNSVYNLVESQSKYVDKIGVVSSLSEKNFFSDKVIFFSILNDSLLDIILKKPITRIISKFGKPDVVVFHDIYNIKQSLLLMNLFKKNIDIYITPRGSFSPVALTRSYFKKRIYYFFFIKPFMKNINAFIALNENESKYITNYTQKKTIIMSNGVNDNSKHYLDNIKNYELKKNSLDVINIGFMGRFDIFIKGLDDLLDAYISFQKIDKLKKINLIFIGSHSVNNEFDSIKYFKKIKKNLIDPNRFVIKDPTFKAEKWAELSKLDILIQPSRTEGMPNTVLEAMSMAIPCCISEETNMSKFILDANSGWVIDRSKKSILDFFNKISVMDKSIFIEKGLNGMKYALENLPWDKVSKPNYL